MKKLALSTLKAFCLPLITAIYPSIFHYANNVNIIVLSSLERMILFNIMLALIVYFIIHGTRRQRAVQSANAAFVFLVFFNTYGIVYTYLLKADLFQVEHYTLLPFYILLGVYMSWFVTKIRNDYSIKLWQGGILVLSVVTMYNLIIIIPAEIKKEQKAISNETASASVNLPNEQNYPDIYFIVFDEFAGFNAMRTYWHNEKVDSFISFLESKDFFVAQESHGSSRDTLHQMATRLNYQDYPLGAAYVDTYYQDIANNKVMRQLKSLGYTTVVFDETRASFAYPAKAPITADYNFEYDPNSSTDLGILFDEYGTLVADNTMLLAFSKFYKINNPVLQLHRNMIYFTVENAATLDVPSPKFIYIHLMLPHTPFMFDVKGNTIDPKFHQNWNYYLGQYNYTIDVAEKMVSNILSQSDPKNPPIIALQSDHGARNKQTANPDSVILENYPEEYKTEIMFTLYIPGYDFSEIPQDVDPINTFPVIFNYLFGMNIPLQ